MMKAKKNVKRTRVIAIVLCGCMLLSGAATVLGAQMVDSVLDEGGYLRAIKANYLEVKEEGVSADTLEPNSKWREEPLKSQLEDALENDLSDTSECEQVWEFKVNPEEGEASYDEVRQWCLDNPKGTDTNKEFLEKYKEDNLVYEKEE